MTAGPELARLAGELERLQEELSELVPAATPASGYEALRQDGELQPWTSAAVRLWEDELAAGGDDGTVHHLAIAHHARAYDLEAAGDDAAFGHFEEALRHWAALHADPEFWRRAYERLAGAMGVPVPGDVVEEARTRLPRNLLEPHLTLAARFRLSEPRRARGHVRLVTGSAFPAAIVAEARADLVREVLDGVPQAVAEGRFGETLDALETWLLLDPAGPGLLRAVLFTGRSWQERLRDEPYATRRMHDLLDRVDRLVRPGLALAPPPSGELAKELARHEFLLALRSFGALGTAAPSPDTLGSRAEVEESLRAVGRASGHVETALELYPELAEDPRYAEVGELRDTVLPRYRAWLSALSAQFLLTAFGIGDRELARARQLLDAAGEHTAADPGLESFVHSLDNLLSIRGPQPTRGDEA